MQLSYRSQGPELIDDLAVDPRILEQTYQEIKNVNDVTLGYWPTLRAARYFLNKYGRNRELKILDVGCGDGETLRRIDRYARSAKFVLKLTGIDLNRSIIDSAVKRTASSNIRYVHGDAFKHREDYDLILSSLTMHHLSDRQIIELVQWMSEHGGVGWFVSDLHRHTVPYYFIKYLTRIFGFNCLLCHDAPLSVARGFKKHEWSRFIREAGIDARHVRIDWYPNFRYGIRYEKLL